MGLLNLLKRKTIFQEILNQLSEQEIAKLQLVCKEIKSIKCKADYNQNISIETEDFGDDFEKYIVYIQWVTINLCPNIRSIYINLSSSQLRDIFEDDEYAEIVVIAYSQLFKQVKDGQSMVSMQVHFNQFIRSRSNLMNERICMYLAETMSRIQINNLERFKVVGHASEELLQQTVGFKNLNYLELKNCQFIEGHCLLDMKVNQLEHLNLMGSYQLTFHVIMHLLESNYKSLKSLILDGEQLEQVHVLEMLKNLKVGALKTFRLYFGQKLEDEFLLLLQSKLDQANLTDFKLRKANQLSAVALESFFASFDLAPKMKSLNFEECLFMSSNCMTLIPQKFPNLQSLSLQWCSKIDNNGLKSILLGCLKLRKLKVTGCKQLSGDILIEVFSQQEPSAFQTLKFIDFQMCDLINDDELYQLKARYNEIKIYNYYREEII